MSLTQDTIDGTLHGDGTLTLDREPHLPAGRVRVVIQVASPVPGEEDGGAARQEALEDRFQQLAAEWRRGVGPLSSVTKIVQHPAYQAIIALGYEVVPLILRDLERRPDHWFTALRTLTGADPIAPEERGRMDRMAAAWIRWGREHGFTW
jgi:hypothetical protein